MLNYNLVIEQCCYRSTDLRIFPNGVFRRTLRSEYDECEPRWNGDLGEVGHDRRRLQATERHDNVGQEVNLSNQDVGRFAVLGQLLRQSFIRLKETKMIKIAISIKNYKNYYNRNIIWNNNNNNNVQRSNAWCVLETVTNNYLLEP